MQIWGKILGGVFGFMFGRIPGLILGVIVGHFFDRGYSQDFSQMGGFGRFFADQDKITSRAIFFHALFAVMGHVAKASGQVSRAEINMASALMDQMQLHGDVRKEAQNAFTEGKSSDFPVRAILKEFRMACHGRRDVLQVFLEILIQAAYADGQLDVKEQKVLEIAAAELGFRRNELLYLLSVYEAEVRFRQQRSGAKSSSSSRGQSLRDAYKILGVSQSATDAEVKKAYRKLMSSHHPDKLVSKGLPAEALELAKQKAQDIQSAYEMINQSRK